MGHSHIATPILETETTKKTHRKANTILASILVPIFIVAMLAVIMLWPSSVNDGIKLGNPYAAPPGASIDTGKVLSAGYGVCSDSSGEAKESRFFV